MKGKKSKQEMQEASALIADFTHELKENRINAARRILFIGEVLGPERIKN